MTYTYIISLNAPIHINSDILVGYNKYPIVCITKKTLEEVFQNEQIQGAILKTVDVIGRDLLDKAFINVRVVDNKARITDIEEPVNKIISQWK